MLECLIMLSDALNSPPLGSLFSVLLHNDDDGFASPIDKTLFPWMRKNVDEDLCFFCSRRNPNRRRGRKELSTDNQLGG